MVALISHRPHTLLGMLGIFIVAILLQSCAAGTTGTITPVAASTATTVPASTATPPATLTPAPAPTATARALPTATSTPSPAPVSPSAGLVRFDADYGTAPSAGWKWGLGEIKTEVDERVESATTHNFAWMFYVVRGSMEIGTGDTKKTFTAGETAIVAARQDHTHRFLPQSHILVFRPADRPFGDFHRGTRLYESDAPLAVTTGQAYKARIREHVLAPGSAAITVDGHFSYVLEGSLTVRDGATTLTQQAGTAFGIAPSGRQLLSNQGTAPVRLIVVDLH